MNWGGHNWASQVPGPRISGPYGLPIASLDVPPGSLGAFPDPSFEHNDYLPANLQHPHGRDPKTPDWYGVLPFWTPDNRKPWKVGQSKACFIWPRDKHTNKPLSSWTRYKDVLSGKGPPVFIGNRTKFGPTKDQWSNWLEFDNFGYRGGEELINVPPLYRKYDFRTRSWTSNPYRHQVWSGVRRDLNNRNLPTMVRNARGQEWTRDGGFVPPDCPEMNGYRYDPWSSDWDYFKPTVVM